MKYFGTDGIRGEYPNQIDEKLAYKTGRALGQFFRGKCVVGCDGRVSGFSLKEALIAGINGAGGAVFDAGIIPTAGISFLTDNLNFNFGVMVSASHNPPQFNGIKIFSKGGQKLTNSTQNSLEFLIDSGYKTAKSNWIKKCDKIDGIHLYTKFLIENGEDLGGINVNLDCAYGAGGNIPYEVFTALNCKVNCVCSEHNGEKINVDCGATYPSLISSLDGLGFAYDGDADRMICSIDNQILDGDSILYTFSDILSQQNCLKDGVVVGTIMANSALEEQLINEKRQLIRTDVGDKNISQLMRKNKYNLGGEQSGHYIFYPFHTSADGIFSSIKLASAYIKNKIKKLNLYFQKTISLPANINQNELNDMQNTYKSQLKRLIIRKSGTEEKIRIMLEGDENIVLKAQNSFESIKI